MKTETKIAIYDKALAIYGEEAQFEQSIEELAELILAFQKFKRVSNDPDSTQKQAVKATNDVIDELADVQIMIDQMKMVFGYINVEKRIGFKLRRLVKRMNDSGEVFNPNQMRMFA
jgi:hypothetical protein